MADSHDLDETRRLLYMALYASKTKKYNLTGTLVNALKHHSGIDDDVDWIAEQVIACVEGKPFDDTDAWIRSQIQRCTDVLTAE